MESVLVNDLKRALLRISPRLYNGLWTIKQRREHYTWMRHQRRLECAVRRFIEEHGLVVQSGPFAGMVYVSEAHGSALLPKLLGSYEAELHDVLARAVERQYDDVVNVGCGEGYYAIGLARRLPNAHIRAFDIDPRSRELCAEMARANNVADRVVIAAQCDVDCLRMLTPQGTLIVMDCEGCELDLLQPHLVPGLSGCDILVELHDFVNRSISQTIFSRFATTHNITVIDSVERDPVAYPVLRALGATDQRLAVAEFRPTVIPMQWAFMSSRMVQAAMH